MRRITQWNIAIEALSIKRSDARIQEDVNDALTLDSFIDASDIEVTVKDGIVTLSGTVPDRKMKRQAEDCVEYIQGVDDVKNEISTKKLNENSDLSKNHGNKNRSGTNQSPNIM